MEATPRAPARKILLVEPQSLFRRTLATVARQLRIADVVEASSYESARALLEAQRFDGLLLAMGDGVESMALLQALRDGKTGNMRHLPVSLLAETVSPATIDLFRVLSPQRILLMPFKVKTALEVVTALVATQGAWFMAGDKA